MAFRRSRAAGARAAGTVLAVAALLAGTTAGAADDPGSSGRAEARVVFSFTDPLLTESSGLVAAGRVMYTTNDSGDAPQIFTVDPATGNTVAVTRYSPDRVADVESLAPRRGGGLWVGDIGDNRGNRATVSVYELPVLGSRELSARRYDLAYPGGPRNAEALLADPRTGRLYLVSKAATGGTVYALPRAPRPGIVNALTPVGRVAGLVTDGAFFPDGRHLLVRSYGGAAVYTFPDLRRVGGVRLPVQPQGEGVAIDPTGRIYLSSEGAFSRVLQVQLPKALRAAAGASGLSRAPGPRGPAGAAPAAPYRRGAGPVPTGEGDTIWPAAGLLVATVAGWLTFTVSRRRSPRRR